MAVQTISESVYVGLCFKIGTSQEVAIRRDVADIMEFIEHKKSSCNIVGMVSGSWREGFRFADSDFDAMFWLNDNQVLWDFSQSSLYNTHRYTLILCDSSESPPGFTLLWLPLEEAGRRVLSSCVRINGALYISSAMYRHNICTLMPNSTVHGPCSSGIRDGVLEYDTAPCFVSNFWPPSASSWTDRCHSWPPHQVVDEIVRSGCHFVAIGHKLGNHADNEWRISFSQAEQKLVYAMNHTQFLTYGLLKLFLKDFNRGKTEEEKLLCSYHMKTAIFWAIQRNTISHWCPQNLLAGFWVCYKILLKWVYEGVCPNFFIPENNMFLNKMSVQCSLRHREAHSVIEMTKVKLAQPGLMYWEHVDPERYTEAVGGRSWSYKMRHAVAYDIKLENCICYINELTPEQQSSSFNHKMGLHIPPYILLHMLEFLCCRHVDPMSAQAALDDLQMTGNRQAALYSYGQSLRQFPLNKVDIATRLRIQDLR
ncbi:uncharacterized protein LOC144627464 [Crassostrea virginica]